MAESEMAFNIAACLDKLPKDLDRWLEGWLNL